MKRSLDERRSEAEQKLADAERRSRRLDSYKAKLRRRIAGLRRWVGRTKPPKVVVPPPADALAMLEVTAETDRREFVRETVQRWADHYAGILGVVKPRVLFAGEKGACRRVKRAHIHVETTRWNSYGQERGLGKSGSVAHHRGTICVNADNYRQNITEDRLKELAAHEVAHLRRSSKHCYRGHGKRMSVIEHSLIHHDGMPTPAQTEEEERRDAA